MDTGLRTLGDPRSPMPAAVRRSCRCCGATRTATTVRPDGTARPARRWVPVGRVDRPSEPTRARQPDRTGLVVRDGARVAYEVFGQGAPGVVFVPPWSIVHSRIWKGQVADMARRHLVVTFDPRGNGRSDRPMTTAGYAEAEFARDLLAVMDATGLERAVLVSHSAGAERSLIAASLAPERILGLVFVGPGVPLGAPAPRPDGAGPFAEHDSWRRDQRGFVEAFFGRCFTEPHSTKQIEDAVGWGTEIDVESLIRSDEGPALDAEAALTMCAAITCPSLIIQGSDDAVTGPDRGRALSAAIPGSRLVWLGGGGHIPQARDPVIVNLLLRDFLSSIATGPRDGLGGARDAG